MSQFEDKLRRFLDLLGDDLTPEQRERAAAAWGTTMEAAFARAADAVAEAGRAISRAGLVVPFSPPRVEPRKGGRSVVITCGGCSGCGCKECDGEGFIELGVRDGE